MIKKIILLYLILGFSSSLIFGFSGRPQEESSPKVQEPTQTQTMQETVITYPRLISEKATFKSFEMGSKFYARMKTVPDKKKKNYLMDDFIIYFLTENKNKTFSLSILQNKINGELTETIINASTEDDSYQEWKKGYLAHPNKSLEEKRLKRKILNLVK